MKRILTALPIGIIWLFILFSGSFSLFWAVMTVVCGIALYEYFNMITAPENNRHLPIGVMLSLFPLIAAFSQRIDLVSFSLVAALLLLFTVVIIRYESFPDPFDAMCKFSFGIVYIGFFASHLMLLMSKPGGPYLLVLLTAVTIASDSTAYYIGSYFGKNKLCPATSPNKTIEGFIGGMAGSVIAALTVTFLFMPKNSVPVVIVTALLLSGIGVVGDLTESVIKRSTNFKDSGGLLPGHGGVLDRIDSLLLTSPFFYYMVHFKLFVGP
ncbi:phosphatidate cytidylyltransferase [Thermodesulfobacteriota bacterium]